MKKQKVTIVEGILTVEYPTIKKSLSVDISKLSDEVREEAMLHGFKQKYGDAESGKTPAEKFAMVQRISEAHYAGSWDLTSKADDGAIVIEAVARVKGIDEEEVEEALDGLDEEKRGEKIREWRSNAKVKAEIAKIRAERAEEAAADSDDDIEL